MALAHRARAFGAALRYRGREGMWTWILHRLTGLGILAFLMIHVVDTAAVIYWPGFYDKSLALYRHPLFRVSEVLIFFAVLFHAVNGLRIIIHDFWPATMRHQRRLVWATAAIVGVSMLPVAWMMLAPIFGLAEEPGAERHRLREERRTTTSAPVSGTAAAVSLQQETAR